MMDRGRRGPAVRAFRHPTPPSALPGDLLAPSAEPAERSAGRGPGRSRAARSALAARSERRRGGSAGEAEGPAAGWGQRRGQRSHWHAAPAPPPRRAGSAGAQRAPPSIPTSRRRGFPVTCPGLGGGTCGEVGRGGQEPPAPPPEQGCGCTRQPDGSWCPPRALRTTGCTCPLTLR